MRRASPAQSGLAVYLYTDIDIQRMLEVKMRGRDYSYRGSS